MDISEACSVQTCTATKRFVTLHFFMNGQKYHPFQQMEWGYSRNPFVGVGHPLTRVRG